MYVPVKRPHIPGRPVPEDEFVESFVRLQSVKRTRLFEDSRIESMAMIRADEAGIRQDLCEVWREHLEENVYTEQEAE